MKKTVLLALGALVLLDACEEGRVPSSATSPADVAVAPAATAPAASAPVIGPALAKRAATTTPGEALPAPRPGKPAPFVVRWDGTSTVVHRDPQSGLTFAIPSAGFRLESGRFDASTPSHQLRETHTLFGPSGPAVIIDVFEDRDSLGLPAFFDKHLGYHVTPTTKVVSRTSALVQLEEPRSPQAYARRMAVFAAGSRIFRVTCIDTADHGAVSAFEHVMKSLSRGVEP